MATELSAFVNDVLGNTTEKGKEVRDFPFVFVAPIGTATPGDDVFSYTTINNLCDFANVNAGSVVLFDETQIEMLRVFCKHADMFEFEVRALYGVPELTYGAWFDDASFDAVRQMYGPLVAEMRVSAEVESIRQSNERSGTSVESQRYTKSNGTVRYADIGVVEEGGDDELE